MSPKYQITVTAENGNTVLQVETDTLIVSAIDDNDKAAFFFSLSPRISRVGTILEGIFAIIRTISSLAFRNNVVVTTAAALAGVSYTDPNAPRSPDRKDEGFVVPEIAGAEQK